MRADSAFYSEAVPATAAKFDVRFSITARQDKRVRAAIEQIQETTWQPIPYWLSTPEVSGADIAETLVTVLASDSRHARQVPLIVRRVRPTPGSQRALFTAWDYHAFVDRDWRWLRSKPTTAGTPSWSRASPSSRAPGWRICLRQVHG